jgi:hypothetical protein
METAVNVLWDARPLSASARWWSARGVVGLLARICWPAIPGLDLVVCDTDRQRGDIVRGLGARFCAPDQARAGATSSSTLGQAEAGCASRSTGLSASRGGWSRPPGSGPRPSLPLGRGLPCEAALR